MNPFIQVRKTTPIFLVTLLCFGLLLAAQAALPPPAPDGGYPGSNTAEGDGALSSVQISFTTGGDNTAIGSFALNSNTTGGNNTATGSGALQSNTTANHNTAIGTLALNVNQAASDNTAIGEQCAPVQLLWHPQHGHR